jgi:hypothetical protein
MIKIFYCNTENEEVAKRKIMAEKHNSHLPFSDLFYRHVEDIDLKYKSIEFKIFTSNEDEENYYINEFKELLQQIYEIYNNKKIRKMTIGDIIEIKTRIIDLRFIIIDNGFKMI